jgi:hypothetical protein
MGQAQESPGFEGENLDFMPFRAISGLFSRKEISFYQGHLDYKL